MSAICDAAEPCAPAAISVAVDVVTYVQAIDDAVSVDIAGANRCAGTGSIVAIGNFKLATLAGAQSVAIAIGIDANVVAITNPVSVGVGGTIDIAGLRLGVNRVVVAVLLAAPAVSVGVGCVNCVIHIVEDVGGAACQRAILYWIGGVARVLMHAEGQDKPRVEFTASAPAPDVPCQYMGRPRGACR